MRHKVVDIGGPVHYLDFGGDGSPLLMVHGLGGSALNWMAVGPAFAERYHAVAIDLVGFGQTPLFKRSAAVGANADLVRRFIDEVLDEPVTLMGNSMGGHISVLVAGAHPERVARVVLVDPAVPGVHVRRPEPAMLGVIAAVSVPGLAETLLDRRAKMLGPEGLVQQTLALVCADPSRLSADLVQAHVQLTRERASLGGQNNRALLQATRSIGLRMADPRFWVKARQVKAPTLVIHGELDRVIPLAAARELVRRVPAWTLKVIEGVGHVPMMETPEAFIRAANGWLEDRIAPAGASIP
ncbi:MAG TPA: alpha/beta hydrolase [Candidatus Dormibacteraeota bacterium]|nr:alpha/beta hydrolase [Candidatus Dormibacteraeota bacterium]